MIVGSGLNSLVAGALLTRAGWGVCVLESSDHLGGAVHTAEITTPGYIHDVYSGFHVLFLLSEAYQRLKPELDARGLQYTFAPVQTAYTSPRHDAVLLTSSHDQNVAEFARHHRADGPAWERLADWFGRHQQLTTHLMGKELWSLGTLKLGASTLRRLGRDGTLRYASDLLESCRDWVTADYQSEAARGFFAPLPLHGGLGPESVTSALMAKMVALSIEMVGMPVPKGGGAKLIDALAGIIRDGGGECRTNRDVTRIEVSGGAATGVQTADGERYRARRAVLANVTPQQLYLNLLREEAISPLVASDARRFRYGRAGMQIHMALSEAPRWRGDSRLEQAASVNLASGLDGVSRAVNEATRRLLPASPTIAIGQHTVADPSRAPKGGATLWVQLLELPSSPVADAAGEIDVGDGVWTEQLRETFADRVQAIIARHITNLDSALVGRAVLSPADLYAANRNHVGGDGYSGSLELDQSLVLRPRPGRAGHRTVVDRLLHIGASTHPGPGLSAGSGVLAADALLRRRRLPRIPRRRG
ncbi:phytoene desaturase family protein [Mycolicibacterium sp. XJ879]